jgi:hypothetical protein
MDRVVFYVALMCATASVVPTQAVAARHSHPSAASEEAAVRAAASAKDLRVVSLRTSPSLRVVVRLDRPVVQLRRGALVPLLRAVVRLNRVPWDVEAINGTGTRLRESTARANGGSAFIRPDLAGCDPSFTATGPVSVGMFGSEPNCVGDPAAPPDHPVDVGGVSVGATFPLTVAINAQRVYALVNGVLYASQPVLTSVGPVGRATMRGASRLVFSSGTSTVTLLRQSGPAGGG